MIKVFKTKNNLTFLHKTFLHHLRFLKYRKFKILYDTEDVQSGINNFTSFSNHIFDVIVNFKQLEWYNLLLRNGNN